MLRFWLVPLFLILLVVAPFLIWGDALTNLMTPDARTGTFGENEPYMWVIGIGLLIADILIPIPTTAIIAALGIIYGPVIGAAIAFVGTMFAAITGYAVGRWLGRPIAKSLIGDAISDGERMFARYGGWIVAASRWLPVLPEVVSMVAGVSRMPFVMFSLSALCGVTPFCILFALLGHLGAEQPAWTLLLSALAPLLLWWLANRFGLTKKYGLSLKGQSRAGSKSTG
jgi:uncharacterized membrane protein YdjX (TVP38/TMEM64 family)